LMTKPDTQVPPVIEKLVAAGPTVFTTAGAAVSVSGPVAAEALLTLTVPKCEVVVPVTSEGLGAEIVTVAPVTVNVTVLVVPPGVTTATVLAPSPAPLAMVKFAVTCVSSTTVKPDTVTPPDTFTAVAPVRPVPVRDTGTVAPRAPEVGLMAVSVGGTTAKLTVLLVPPGVVTLTVLVESAAVNEIVKVAVTAVALTTVRLLTVIPVPDTVIAVVPVRLVPVSVTLTVLARRPELGAIEVSIGGETPVPPWNSTAPMSM